MLSARVATRSGSRSRAHQSRHRALQHAGSSGAQKELQALLRLRRLRRNRITFSVLLAKTQNKPAEAIVAFQKVLRIDPNDVGANVNLGQLYAQQRKYPEAMPQCCARPSPRNLITPPRSTISEPR